VKGRNLFLLGSATVLVLASIIGCGGSNNPATPNGIAIQLDSSEVNIGASVGLRADYSRSRASLPDCSWYVNDILGGSTELGTIAQDNPTVYEAPVTTPAEGQVVIKAVTNDADAFEDVATLTVHGPVGVNLSLSSSQLQVAEEATATASLVWGLRDDAGFDWYVDDVLGGNAMVGTISQDNPAAYTAPSAVPAGGSVTIKAVYRGDETLYDAEAIQVRFTVKYVDADSGVDVTGAGTSGYPFRTISYALGETESGDTVRVAAGTYDSDLGESSVITVPAGVALIGEDRDACLVYGGKSQYYTMELLEGSLVETLTLGNAGVVAGDSLSSIGIYSQATATIRDVKINDYFNYSAIRIDGENNSSLIENCEIVNTSDPGYGRGLELVFGSHAIVRNTTLGGWFTGIFANTTSDPLVEYCSITGNVHGVEAYGGSGDPPPVTNPDLGGGARGSQGQNLIQGNSEFGLYVQNTEGTIYAVGNTWNSDPPTEGDPPADFFRLYDTAIVWQ